LAILRLANSALNSNGKGSIGEIKTGEGKSFIVSTLAILLCQYGKKVDIIFGKDNKVAYVALTEDAMAGFVTAWDGEEIEIDGGLW
jgi:hypothetical protein